MTTNTQSHYCLYWGKILLLGLTLLFAGCRDGDDDSEVVSPPPPNPPPKAYQGQAILGPLVDASVEVYTLSTLDSAPIYTATTSSDDRLDQSGLFTIPEDLVDDNELYLIKVTGGQDIDADDNGSMDDNPTANQGTIHALLTPDQIRGSRFHVSILTELLYQRLYYLLAANYPKETLLVELNRRAPLVLAVDVDGDEDRDADDVAVWHPVRDATKLRHGFAAYQPMIASVHNGEPLKEMPLTSFVLSSLDITGFANSVAVLDDIAYIAAIAAGEAGLQIVDVRNPTKPIQLGSLSLGSPDTSVYAQDVAVANGIAYVAVSTGGLKTVDVHDPVKPILLGSLDMPDFWTAAVTVVDSIAYLGGNRGLYAVDVHDPAKPFSLGALDTQNITPAIVVSDSILYQVTCNYRGFHLGFGPSPVQIYDVHEPGTPTLLAVWDTPTPECGQDIAVVNRVAYLIRGGSLQILDVHDPANPRSLSSLYTGDYASNVAVTQGFAYVNTFSGIQVVDVRDPTKPTLLGLIENMGSSGVRGLSIVDGLAYLVSDSLSGGVVPSSRLKVIDISNPFNAVMNSARIGSMGSDYSDVAAVDKTAYVVGRIPGAGMGGLHAIDAQDPTNPVLLGSLGPPYWPSHVAVTHGMAFVTNGDYEGLHAVDVNNPTSPALIKSFSIMSSTDVMTTSDIAYVTTTSVTTSDSAGNEVKFPASLYLLDARNPATLEVLGSLSFGGDPNAAKGVAVADGIAYVVVDIATIGGEGINWRGLQVVDARNPAQPVVIGSIPFSSSFAFYCAVAAADGVAYVVDNVNGLQLVDVHNSSSPFLLGSIPFDSLELPGDARNIAVTDSFAYIAGSAGVQVMDIRDPLNPIHIFSLSTPTAAEAVTISDGYVYVAAGYPSGLQIFQAAVRQVP